MVGLANWTSQSGMQAGDTPWLMQGANEAINKGVGNLKDGITGLYGQLQQNNSDSTLSGLLSGAHSYADIQNKIAANPSAFADLSPQGRQDLMALQSGFDKHDYTNAQIGHENAETNHTNAIIGEMPQRLTNETNESKARVLSSNSEAAYHNQLTRDAALRTSWDTQDRNSGLGAAQVQGSLNDPAGYQNWQITHPGGTIDAYKNDVLSGVKDPQVRARLFNTPGIVQFLHSAQGPDPSEGHVDGNGPDKLGVLVTDTAVQKQKKEHLNQLASNVLINNKGLATDYTNMTKFYAPNMTRQSAIDAGLTDDGMNYARGMGLTGGKVYAGAYLLDKYNKMNPNSTNEEARQDYIRNNLSDDADKARADAYHQQAHVQALLQRHSQNATFINSGVNYANRFRGSSVVTPSFNSRLSNAISENEEIEREVEKLENLQANAHPFEPAPQPRHRALTYADAKKVVTDLSKYKGDQSDGSTLTPTEAALMRAR